MVDRTTRPAVRLLAMLAVVSVVTGCGRNASTERQHAAGTPGAGAPAAPLAGSVTVDGSSTVMPVSAAMADAFQTVNPGVRVALQTSGTGGGFRTFCAGGVDLTGASRPITSAENEECRTNKVEYIELPVAFDSLSVVVNPANPFASCLTVAELRQMWEPAAQGKVTRWNQIRSAFPAEPLALFGPGKDSGTFDYFTLAVVGTQSSSRDDYTKSEDDEVIARGVAGDPHALGYFGYAYYQQHRDTLRLVAIDSGKGCITPTFETAADNSYQPLSRPIFLYVNKASAARAETSAFAQFYVDLDNAHRIREVGYMPLPPATLLGVGRRLSARTTGSIFDGRGSILVLTADTFEDEDRIRNALVQ